MHWLKSGQRIFIHGGAATPNVLIKKIIEFSSTLKDIEILHLHTHGEGLYAHPDLHKNFRVINLFVGTNIRPFIDYQSVDYLPCFLSEIPALFRSHRRRLDVALIQVSPPNRHGYCSLGVSVDVCKAAIESSQIIVAQINQQMPFVHGDGFIHRSQIHHAIEVNEPIYEAPVAQLTVEEKKIGELVSSLIEDGSTLQMGIGAVPDAVLNSLGQHKNLGIHTEMWSNGLLPLLKSGVVNNSLKKVHPGKTVSTFIIGSREVYDFINDNPSVIQLEASYVNDTSVIARNPKVVAINSAVEVDLTGQICADSVGHRIVSGVGGQMDFIRGASLSLGGKPVIALTSRTKKNVSRIVFELKPGSGVVTTRAHVHYVVTEYGIVDLYGLSLGERAKALINIAHPDEREKLSAQWHSLTGPRYF